jgi:uncharacterized protein (DUF2384 family)
VTQEDEITVLVYGFFKEVPKTIQWLATPNPLLGMVRPIEMIRAGRGDRVLGFVKYQLGENVLP